MGRLPAGFARWKTPLISNVRRFMAVPRAVPLWFALLFLIFGAYIIVVSLGLLPYTYMPSLRRRALFDSPQHWQVTSFGIAFFCAGASIILANRGRWLPALAGTVLLVASVAPMAWLLYLSG